LLRRQLDKGWAVVAMGPPAPQAVLGRRFSAEVPGCVSTDLMAAGVLPDPYLGTNEELHAWVGRTRWRYETTLVAGPPEGGRPEAGRPGEGTEL
jgi:beta-mannosidase